MLSNRAIDFSNEESELPKRFQSEKSKRMGKKNISLFYGNKKLSTNPFDLIETRRQGSLELWQWVLFMIFEQEIHGSGI